MLQTTFLPIFADEHEHIREGAYTMGGLHREMRDFHFIPEDAETDPVTFLGIHTAQIDGTLSAQLGLPKGMGLTVRYVVPESPAAAAGLKEHDILRKLDDQILIHPQQLQVLIRSRNEGDSASFTVLREGSEIKIKAVLQKKEPAKYERTRKLRLWFEDPDSQGGSGMMHAVPGPRFSAGGAHLDHDVRIFTPAPGEFNRTSRAIAKYSFDESAEEIHHLEDGVAGRRTIIKMKNKKMVMKDGEGVLTLLRKDGKRHLIAKDEEGNEIFSGPIDSPEERMSLPPELREKVKELESTEGFDFDSERSIHPGKMEFIRAYRGEDVTGL